MKPINIIFSLSICLCMVSCNNQNSAFSEQEKVYSNNISGTVEIYAEASVQELLNKLAAEFNKEYTNVEFVDSGIESELILLPENKRKDLTSEYSWQAIVMKEGIIPVIAQTNPYLEILKKEGITKIELKSVIDGTIKNWGELVEVDNDNPISILLPDQSFGLTKKLKNFLNLDIDQINAEYFHTKEEFRTKLVNNPLAIGLMNACCVYDPESNQKIDSIESLPIDFNENGTIDSKEDFYDDLCSLERALYLGVYPSTMCTNILLFSKSQPENAVQKEFINWVMTKGQKYVEELGYSKIRNIYARKVLNDLENPLN